MIKRVHVLPVANVATATRFYESAFPSHFEKVDPTGSCKFSIGEQANEAPIFRLVPADELPPLEDDERVIDSEHAPVVEFVVDDVSEWMNRAVAAGATATHNDELTLVQLSDPFGYRWMLAAADDPDDEDDL